MESRIPHLMVFVDSPMAVRVSKVFKDHPELFDTEMKDLIRKAHSPFDMPNLKPVISRGESKALNSMRGTGIIIAGSGMCTGGRIKHHLSFNISRSESTILFVGYQAVGTLGRKIQESNRQVRIYGRYRDVNAQISQIDGFSAHADRKELLRWLTAIKKGPKNTFVVHGEPESALSLVEALRERGAGKVVAPTYGQRVELN